MNAPTAAALCSQLIPQPRRVEPLQGQLDCRGRPLVLQIEGAWSATSYQQAAAIVAHFSASTVTDSTADPLRLRLRCHQLASYVPVADVDERYRLELRSDHVLVDAPTATGMQRGLVTVLQLLARAAPAPIRVGESAPASWDVLPCLRIDDQPELPWRGLLLDVARHFIEPAALIRVVDGMAHHKLNVLHLHLTDDQGFRFESSAFPKLNSGGAFYKADELKQLVAYAGSRGIRVVPELDMPGHTIHWLAAYPEWSLYPVEQTERFGVHSACLNPCSELTYSVIGTLLDEFAAVFPDDCVHVGGDEVHPRWWSEHDGVQSFMAEQNLQDTQALQAYFNNRVAELLQARGKRMVVWDEAVHANLPDSVLVQAWRGMAARDRALASGFDCVVSAPYYLDLFYPAELHTAISPQMAAAAGMAVEDQLLLDERLAHVAGGLAWTRQWREHAPVEGAARKGAVVGAEACLWSELVTTELLDVRLWSRLPLLAERFWCEETVAGGPYTRIQNSLVSWALAGGPELVDALCGGLSSDQLDLLAPQGITPEMAPLLATIEPVKWYARLLGADALAARLSGSEMPQARPYKTGTPLNRIADVISPQSFVAAELSELLQRWQLAPLEATDKERLQRWLSVWQSQAQTSAELATDNADSETLRALAARLQSFAALLEKLCAEFSDSPLHSQALASIDAAQLRDWLAPVDELMLAVVAPLLAMLPDDAGETGVGG